MNNRVRRRGRERTPAHIVHTPFIVDSSLVMGLGSSPPKLGRALTRSWEYRKSLRTPLTGHGPGRFQCHLPSHRSSSHRLSTVLFVRTLTKNCVLVCIVGLTSTAHCERHIWSHREDGVAQYTLTSLICQWHRVGAPNLAS